MRPAPTCLQERILEMRKIFGGSLVFSLVGVAVLGAVFAWNLTETVSGDARVGTAAINIQYEETENIIGPNGYLGDNGSLGVLVGTGGVGLENGSEFSVQLKNELADLKIDTVTNNIAGLCNTTHFDGTTVVLNPGYVIEEAGYIDGDSRFAAYIYVDEDAPASCMGQTVGYTITVGAVTLAPIDEYNGEDQEIFPPAP